MAKNPRQSPQTEKPADAPANDAAAALEGVTEAGRQDLGNIQSSGDPEPTSDPASSGDAEATLEAATDADRQHLADSQPSNDFVQHTDGGAQADAQGETITTEPSAVFAPLAAQPPQEIDKSERETLLGTIGLWGAAGAAEVARVSENLHRFDWTPPEAALIAAALERVSTAATTAITSLRIVGSLSDLLLAHDLTAADILAFDESSGVAVTRAGRKISLS